MKSISLLDKVVIRFTNTHLFNYDTTPILSSINEYIGVIKDLFCTKMEKYKTSY